LKKKIENIYIGLGSNIGDREHNLNKSISLITKDSNIILLNKSNIYESKPMYNLNQANFLNMVIEIRSDLDVISFFNYIQNIEKQIGRPLNRIKNSPRVIDLDILIFKNEIMDNNILTIPHTDLNNRAFVIIPMNDIASELIVPLIDKSIGELMLLLDYNNDIIKLYKQKDEKSIPYSN
tara:strand:+ start:596 stop:1132 length:537 start_codon:yes stop_codon:yes gene_type:complete